MTTITEYRNHWQKRKRKLMAYGRWEPLEQVDPTQAREHLRNLRDTYGLSIVALATLSHLPPGAIVGLLYENSHQWRSWITRDTEAAVLAAAFDLDALPATAQVNATGTRRRLQALAVMGWSLPELAERTGMVPETISKLRRHGKVAVSSARLVRRLFAELAMTPGPSRQAALRATAAGWVGPLAWDDIDDPNEVPNLGDPDSRAKVHMDDLEHLVRQGYDQRGAAEAFGVKWNAVEQACYRAHRHDLLEGMRRNRDQLTGRAS